MIIQWFPGHMAKTRRLISENLKLVDVVIELLDARIPLSSRNPEIDSLVGHKPRVIALNKSDLSDPTLNREWASYFAKQGIGVIYTNAISGTGLNELKGKLKELTRSKLESAQARGRIQRPIKTMVVGIPNVGKSAFINKLAGKASAITGDRPGVTRTKQWVRVNPEIQLLDTPGILWPKFEDPETGLNLAFTGAIKDEIMDTAELAAKLLEKLAVLYPDKIKERYKLEELDGKIGLKLLEEAGRKRGCLVSGGEVDLYRIASIVLDEFRGGRIGKITLEKPQKESTNEENDH
ncbi:MAG: ribosome biogenesis GTPase YlqF [Clostridiaceae bacterium]|nr:ribosome biogenesis GTPase YlqF [Clostridiaceae bacterium]